MIGLAWDVDKLLFATEAAGVALWSWNVDTDRLELDERGHVLWGVPNIGTITFETLSARIHPQDLDRVRAAFAATRDILGSYETDFRILHGDKVRWISQTRHVIHQRGLVFPDRVTAKTRGTT